MALQSSGAISASDINTELLETISTDVLSFDSVKSRGLSDIASGAISFSDFYGKASAGIVQPVNVTPADDAVDTELILDLISSDFTMIGDTDTLIQREYRVKLFSDSSIVYNPTVYLAQPTNVSPTNAATGIALSPALETSDFSVVGATDTLDQKEYMIQKTSDDSIVYNPVI